MTTAPTSERPGVAPVDEPQPAPAPREPLGRRFTAHLASTGLSNLGDGVLQLGAPLVALTLTRSPSQVALIGAFAWLPWLVLGIAGGVLVDRTDRRRVRLAALAARAALLAAAAGVAASGRLTMTVLLAVVLAYGVTEVVADLAGSALVPDLAPRSRLQAANSRLMAVEQVANAFLGAPLGALVLAAGTGWVFGVPAGLAVAAAAATWSIRGTYRARSSTDRADAPTGAVRRAWSDVRDGLTFLWHHPVQRPLLVSAGLTNMANTAYFAVFVLWMVGEGSRVGLTATQYALVVTVLAVGAVLGSLVAEPLHRRLKDARLLCGAWTANAVLLLVPVLVPQPFVIAGAVLLLGATNTVGNVTSQSMRQRMVPRAMLGRVAGAGRTVAFGLMPVGALLGGAVAEHAGLPTLFVGAALLALACTVGVALTVRQRTIDACELPDDAR